MSDLIKAAISAIYGRKSNNPSRFKPRNDPRIQRNSRSKVWVILAVAVISVCLIALVIGWISVSAKDTATFEPPPSSEYEGIVGIVILTILLIAFGIGSIKNAPKERRVLMVIYVTAMVLVVLSILVVIFGGVLPK